MTNFSKWTIGLVVLMLFVSFIVIWNIQSQFFKSEGITIQEATTQIETLYSGKVESFEQKNNVYYLSLKRNKNIYDIQVDPSTGKVIHFSKVKGASSDPTTTNLKTADEIRTLISSQNKGTILTIALQKNASVPQYIVEITDNDTLKTLIVHAETGVILSKTTKEVAPTKPTVTAISSEMAKQIALSHLYGNVNYVVFEEEDDGGYYLVEISNAEQKAVLQITLYR
ncbi:Peptidase YpeB-like protein OS=Ureibacillus acetophenoni OX=614649 GN=SAMN05877842_1085 PE=4 SV=1 [Ureibacillus acetophenoni]